MQRHKKHFDIAINSTTFSLLLTSFTEVSGEKGFAQSLGAAHGGKQTNQTTNQPTHRGSLFLVISRNHGSNIFLEVLLLKTLKCFYYEIFTE